MGGRMPPKSAWFGPAMLAMISVPFDVFFDEFSRILEKWGGGGDKSFLVYGIVVLLSTNVAIVHCRLREVFYLNFGSKDFFRVLYVVVVLLLLACW
jgi:hypothetical protein